MGSAVNSSTSRPPQRQHSRGHLKTRIANLIQNIIHGWYRLTGPTPGSFSHTIRDQERLRRAHLLSCLFVLIPIAIALILPDIGYRSDLWLVILYLAIFGTGSVLFNRRGLVLASGLTYIIGTNIAVIFLIVTPSFSITNLTATDLDLLVLPTLIGGLVLYRQHILPLAIFQILLLTLLFFLLPHDPLLTKELKLHANGNIYAALDNAYLIQVCGALIAWLGAWSVDSALLRASRAEELAEARIQIEEKTHMLAEQQNRLQQGITMFKEVQARVANGDYNARATLESNELLPVALSFNLMAERLGRQEQMEREYQRLYQALRLFYEAYVLLIQSGSLMQLQVTGTPVDQLIPLLERAYYMHQRMGQGVRYVDEIFVSVQVQQALLAQLHDVLVRTGTHLSSATSAFSMKTTGRQSEQTNHDHGHQEQREEGEYYKWSIEEATQLCNQARQAGTNFVQRIRVLRQLLTVH